MSMCPACWRSYDRGELHSCVASTWEQLRADSLAGRGIASALTCLVLLAVALAVAATVVYIVLVTLF